MSGRLVLFLAAAGAALLSAPAEADPECFGASCRMTPQALMPRVEDPPRLVMDNMAMDATGNLVDVTPPPMAEAPAPVVAAPEARSVPRAESPAASVVAAPDVDPAPVATASTPPLPPLVPPLRPRPQMVVDPVPAVAPVPPRYTADTPPPVAAAPVPRRHPPAAKAVQTVRPERARPEPARPQLVRAEPVRPQQVRPQTQRSLAPPPDADEQNEPAAEARHEVRAQAPVAQEPQRVRVVVQGQNPPAGEPRRGRVVSVAPQIHVEGSVVVVGHPDAHDPAWRRCQVEGRRHCGPASYHPYGEQGYRPYGSYRAYATAPGYIGVAPDPRIISIVRD